MKYFYVYTGNSLIPSATVKIIKEENEFISASTGDGPVDALFKAIDSALNLKPRLKEYVIQAIGKGKDAQGQVNLTIEIEGRCLNGKAISTDIVEASALAYLRVINRYYWQKMFF